MVKFYVHLLLLTVVLGATSASARFVNCESARLVVVLGDSLCDTGNFDAVYPGRLIAPYNNGRFCNGKVLLEYAAQGVNPFGGPLSPYFQGLTGYKSSVNFAFGGSTATSDIFSPEFTLAAPFFLGNQLTQFEKFKSIVDQGYYMGSHPSYPAKYQLDNALYFVLSGGNDINYANFFLNRTEYDMLHSVIPHVTNTIAQVVNQLSSSGAKEIVVVNLPPQGCNPYYLANLYVREGNATGYDELGCSLKYNNITVVFNQHLKDSIRALNVTATVIFADYYNAALEIYNNPAIFGMDQSTMLDACCARGEYYNCDTSSLIGCGCNATNECANPNSYISWDGVHYTDSWNKHLSKLLFQQEYGSKYLDPPYPLF